MLEAGGDSELETGGDSELETDGDEDSELGTDVPFVLLQALLFLSKNNSCFRAFSLSNTDFKTFKTSVWKASIEENFSNISFT